MGNEINCRALAGKILDEVKGYTGSIQHNGRELKLAVIWAGDDAGSAVYVRNKERACASCGIRTVVHRFDGDVPERLITDWIRALNDDPEIDGIILQHPVPSLDFRKLVDWIRPEKDVDGLTTVNQGAVMTGRGALRPCTALAVTDILEYAGIGVSGKNVCIIGRSNIVGRPLSALMTAGGATVTLCHSGTRSIAEEAVRADIVISATGRAHLIKPEMIKQGAVLIDVGISRSGHTLAGDIDPECYAKASHYTTVPGGVGPVTVAELARNVAMADVFRQIKGADE